MLVELILFLVELVIGVVFPLYVSIRNMIETSPEGPQKFANWCFYWMVFSTLQVLGWYLDWLSLFTLVKFGLIIFMVVPKVNGASILFNLFNKNVIERVNLLVGSLVKGKKE